MAPVSITWRCHVAKIAGLYQIGKRKTIIIQQTYYTMNMNMNTINGQIESIPSPINNEGMDLENAARMLEIACLQDEFATVNEDNFFEVREMVSEMKYRVNCWDEMRRKFSLLLEEFHRVDWMMHEGKICFSAIPIMMLLGITLKDSHGKDGVLVFDKKPVEHSAVDEHWIEANAVLMLINSESPYPMWLRKQLSSWFETYCQEVKKTHLLLP